MNIAKCPNCQSKGVKEETVVFGEHRTEIYKLCADCGLLFSTGIIYHWKDDLPDISKSKEPIFDGPDYSVKPPDIEWVLPPEPPQPPNKRIIKEDIEMDSFLKGFIWAFLIIILVHIGMAYAMLFV